MSTPYIAVQTSPIEGKGTFALRNIPKSTRLIEYKGRRRKWSEFEDHADSYAFLFDVGNGKVIDPFTDGNEARFINHSCDPNSEAVIDRGRIFIETIRAISPGEEITYDYSLTLDRPPTPTERKRHACRCGSRNCRKTLFAPRSA
jgi:uncharacterized protein